MNSIKHMQNEQFDQNLAIFGLGNDKAYQAWREMKLAQWRTSPINNIISARDLSQPNNDTLQAIADQCDIANMAIYQLENAESDPEQSDAGQQELRIGLKNLCRELGLVNAEGHRSQGDQGVVSIKVSNKGVGAGYIPYSDKPLSWHTDGYYNDEANRIRAMVLHCVQDASEGGVNELLDPQVVYMRLRDENPAYIEAMRHPQAMTIPENTDTRSAYRPDSVGPVFFLDETNGALNMRYSARKRNIIWRDDKDCAMAQIMMREIMADDEFVVRHKMKPGQGIISNNILHNRTGFKNSARDIDNIPDRLMYRIRYLERVTYAPN